MANFKELKTKILLKQQTYAEWTANTDTGANYIPLYGEVCFCEITPVGDPGTNNNAAQTAPTVLFKVGTAKKNPDGSYVAETAKKFSELKWASALAADVYAWAKCQTVELDGEIIKFHNGDKTKPVHTIDLSKFALDADLGDVSALTTTAKTAVGAINEHDAEIGDLTSLNTTNKSNLVNAINEALQAVEVGGTGSIVTVTKEATATTGSHSTYVLKQGGKAVGDKIEIPVGLMSIDIDGQSDALGFTTDAEGKVTATFKTDDSGNVNFSQTASGLRGDVDLSDYMKTADETALTISDKTDTDTEDEVYVVSNLTEGGTKGHSVTATYAAVPTKAYVDARVSGAVEYLGTVNATTGLSTTAGKGDFYRASAQFTIGSETVHTGDIVIAVKDNPTRDLNGWDVAHLEIDTNTWTENTKAAAGYVKAGGTNYNKVWKTDASGNPDWRDDAKGITDISLTTGADAPTAGIENLCSAIGGVSVTSNGDNGQTSEFVVAGSGAAKVSLKKDYDHTDVEDAQEYDMADVLDINVDIHADSALQGEGAAIWTGASDTIPMVDFVGDGYTDVSFRSNDDGDPNSEEAPSIVIKTTIPDATTTTKGIAKLGATGGAAKYDEAVRNIVFAGNNDTLTVDITTGTTTSTHYINGTEGIGIEKGNAEDDPSNDVTNIYLKDKAVTTAKIADHAVGAVQLKSDKDYAGEDAEVWVLNCNW